MDRIYIVVAAELSCVSRIRIDRAFERFGTESSSSTISRTATRTKGTYFISDNFGRVANVWQRSINYDNFDAVARSDTSKIAERSDFAMNFCYSRSFCPSW